MSKKKQTPPRTMESWENPAYLNAEAMSTAIMLYNRDIDTIKKLIDQREQINLPAEALLSGIPTRIINEDSYPPIAYAATYAKKGEDSHFSVAITALLIKKGALVDGEAGTSAVRKSFYKKDSSSLVKLLNLHGAKTSRGDIEEENPIVINADNAKIHEDNREYAEAAALYLKNATISIQGANELHQEHQEFFNRQKERGSFKNQLDHFVNTVFYADQPEPQKSRSFAIIKNELQDYQFTREDLNEKELFTKKLSNAILAQYKEASHPLEAFVREIRKYYRLAEENPLKYYKSQECKYTEDCSDLIRNGILEYTITHHLNPAINALANTHDHETYRKAIEQKIGLLKILGGRDTEITEERKKIRHLSPPPDVHVLNKTFSSVSRDPDALRHRTIARDKASISLKYIKT